LITCYDGWWGRHGSMVSVSDMETLDNLL